MKPKSRDRSIRKCIETYICGKVETAFLDKRSKRKIFERGRYVARPIDVPVVSTEDSQMTRIIDEISAGIVGVDKSGELVGVTDNTVLFDVVDALPITALSIRIGTINPKEHIPCGTSVGENGSQVIDQSVFEESSGNYLKILVQLFIDV